MTTASKVPQTYTKNGVLYMRELTDRDETFDLAHHRAGKPIPCPICCGAIKVCLNCRNKSTVSAAVVVITIRGGKEVPIMEFDSTGRLNEVPAPRLHTSLAQRMMERIFDIGTTDRKSKRHLRDMQVNAGLLKWYEKQGGRI